MAGTILTPNLIWKNFFVAPDFKPVVIKEEVVDDIVYTHLYFSGKNVSDGTVKIYGVMAKGIQHGVGPAILLPRDFYYQDDAELVSFFVNKGYTVLSIDLMGKRDGPNYYTSYPQSLSFANYEKAKEELYTIRGGVQESCWYEWACAVRYALGFLKSKPEITKVGAIGIGESATAVWEAAGMDANLDCALFVLNTGWIGYRGINKFGGMVEPQFSDNMYKFIAGVEPQAYAMHVKCPTLVLSSTNSKNFDADRAYDTISRIDDQIFSGVNYSVGYREKVSEGAFNTASVFLNNFLMKEDDKKGTLPFEIDVKCEILDGKMIVTVSADDKNLETVALYASEQTVDPSKRSWHKSTAYREKTAEGFVFEYLPYKGSEIVTFFAQCTYKSGYEIGSKIIAKRFKENEIDFPHKSKILYSSRIQDAESVFAPADDNENALDVFASKRESVKVNKGPMGISGVCSESGLLSFKINANKDKPSDNSILMFDVYSKEKGHVTVRLIADYYGQKTEYVAWVSLLGGEMWQNVRIALHKFKTEEGMTLKSYEKIQAIAIKHEQDGKYLINNVLWV